MKSDIWDFLQITEDKGGGKTNETRLAMRWKLLKMDNRYMEFHFTVLLYLKCPIMKNHDIVIVEI